MDREKILQIVNQDPAGFLAKVNVCKRVEMQICDKKCVFIRNHIKGGVEVFCDGFWIHLKLNGVWACD